MKAETNFDSLEELRLLAVSKGWPPESVQVAQSVEQALEAAEQAYKKQAGEWSHMSCLITGSSYLVAEALALLEVSGT
jgi:folylpolyglutamate synthase/dihydropteroate synthase